MTELEAWKSFKRRTETTGKEDHFYVALNNTMDNLKGFTSKFSIDEKIEVALNILVEWYAGVGSVHLASQELADFVSRHKIEYIWVVFQKMADMEKKYK